MSVVDFPARVQAVGLSALAAHLASIRVRSLARIGPNVVIFPRRANETVLALLAAMQQGDDDGFGTNSHFDHS